MKTPPRWFFKLLIWLGLGTALPSALIPQISSGSNPEVTRELSTLKDLQIGLMSFETEYGFYPLSEGETMKDDLEIHTANIRLVGALLGQNLVDNKRGIRFVEFPMANRGKSGLVEREGGLWLVDGNWEQGWQMVRQTLEQSAALAEPSNASVKPSLP
jgi:hypothetical protein